MSEKNKNGKAKKILLTVAASAATLTSPLLILAGTDNVVENNVVSTTFSPDFTIEGNVNTKEYENVETRYFGFKRYPENIYYRLLPYEQFQRDNQEKLDEINKISDKHLKNEKLDALWNSYQSQYLEGRKAELQKMVKFIKEPTADDWNKKEQTWEIAYDTKLLNNAGTYIYGQRVFGFMLSNDLEALPGTVSLRLEYVNKDANEGFDFYKNQTYWGDPDKIPSLEDYPESNFLQYPGDNEVKDFEKIKGLYLRFADKNEKFDFSADQKFNKSDYWMKNMVFDMESGTNTMGTLLYNDYDENSAKKKMEINIFPAITNYQKDWKGFKPRINAIEYITSDADTKSGYSPYVMDELMSRNLAGDFGFEGLNHVFGIGVSKEKNQNDPNAWPTKIYMENENLDNFFKKKDFYTYNQYKENAGTTFLINLDNGLETSPGAGKGWLNDAKKSYKIYLKFKTKRKVKDVLSGSLEGESRRKVTENSFLNKNDSKSFVSALYHTDYYNNGWWKKEQRFQLSNADSSPIANGEKNNQYSAEVTSFATRTNNRNVTFNITENINSDSMVKFPVIAGYSVYKDDQKIDSIKVDWNENKNNENFIDKKSVKTSLTVNLNTLSLKKMSDLDNIYLVPYYANDDLEKFYETTFKWNVSRNKFAFNKDNVSFTGTITYKISPEEINKQKLLAALKNQDNNNLLYKNTPLTKEQIKNIAWGIEEDFDTSHFSHTIADGETNKYSDFWQNFIQNVSKANKDKNELDAIDTDSVLKTRNYRLSQNKAAIDQLAQEIKALKSINLDNFDITIKYPSKEVSITNDPTSHNFDEKIKAWNDLMSKMDGDKRYNSFVSMIDKRISLFEETNKLYFLAKTLNNDADKVATIFDLAELKTTAEKLKAYLDTEVTSETFNDFISNVANYLTKYHNIKIIESFISEQSSEDTSNNKYKLLYKWFNSTGAKQELEGFKEELKSDTNVSDSNVYDKIVNKYNTYNKISQKLDLILKNNNFNYWSMFEEYVKEYLPSDVINSSVLKELLNPLKLAVANINDYDNLVVLSDTGFADVIFGYIFNDWLIKNDKYSVPTANAYSKKEGAEKLKAILFEICEFLKQNAQPDTLSQTLLANKNYLEAILKAKILLKDTKTLATQLSNLTNKNTIKNTSEIEELLNKNLQFDILKQAAAGLKEKINDNQTFSNIKNSKYKNQIISEIEKTITYYNLNEQRIAQDQGDAFYKTNESVKSDWDSFGDFYSLNNLSKEEYTKEFKDLKEATNANVDQFYKAKWDELQALNSKIASLVETINATELNQEAKEALNNLAQQADSIEAVEAIESKLNTVIKAYKDLDTVEKAANNVKNQAENNYKFASNEPKSAFDTLLDSQNEKKAEINKTKVAKADDLENVVSVLNTLTQEIKDKQEALDGEKQLKDLQDKVTKEVLLAYSEEQIQGLKDALAKTADLDAAKAKATQYSEFNSEVIAAKELVAKFDEITKENKYINATSDKKSVYDASAKALKQFVEGYQAKIDEYKSSNPDTWTNNLPTMKSELSKIVNKYNQDLKALNGDKALEEAKKVKNDLIDKFTNISESLKAAFKEKINSQGTTDAVDAKFNELKDIDSAYGTTINPLTKLQGLINSDKFEALKGEPEYDTIKEDLANIEKNFDNKKGNVDLTKEKVEELLSQINSDSKTIETKYDEFNKYREEQKNKIDELESLANGQKETLKRDIDRDKNKAQVNATVETAKEVNTSMKNLRDIYAQAEKVKTTPKYLNASSEPKANFDQQLSNELVNPDGAIATDPSTIDGKAETLKDAIDRLDGDDVLNKAKEDANKEIDKLTNLSETQKAAVKAGISSANEVKDINDLVNKAKTFNKSIQDLKDQVTTDTNNKQTTKYQQADKGPKEAYDAKAQAVADKLKELQELSLDNNLANATAKEAEGASAIQAAKDAYAGLNGDNKLADAKSQANGALDALTNLNSEVINNFKQEIAKANDVTTVNNIKDKAVAQNTLVGDIVSSLSQAEALKQNKSVYNKATQEQKEALENAIKDVKENILDSSAKKMKPNDLTDQLQAKKDAIDNAIKAINKLSGEITEAQNKAKEEINELKDLTQAQKDALNAKVDSATTKENIESIVENAKKLDTATKALKDAIEQAKQVNKQANNYKFANPEKQSQFDTANLEATTALNAGLADKDANAINDLAKNLTDSIGNLNGDAKLNNNKEEANKAIDKLSSLTEEQRDSIKDKVSNANDDAEVNKLQAAAEKLNKALKEAQEAASEANTAKESDNYKQASQTPKSDFDSKKQALDSEIETAKETTSFNDAKAINDLADKLVEATDNSNDAKSALDGETLLTDARSKAQSALNNVKHLSDEYKNALQAQITNAKEVDKLNELTTNIPTLDIAAGNLNEVAKKLETALKDPEYANASEDTKAKVAQAQRQNEDLLTNSLLNNGKVKGAIETAIAANNTALEAIKADKEALATERTKAKAELDKLTNISQAQKQSIVDKIDKVNTTAEVLAQVANAQKLDAQMAELINSYNKFVAAKNEAKYTQASLEVKNNFDTLYNNKDTWTKENQTAIDPETIKSVVETIKSAYNSLDGEQNLAKAKEDATNAIDKLTNIDKTAKDAAKDAVNKAKTVEAANGIATKETALDSSLGGANNALTAAKALKETPQYKEATDSKQEAFDNAIKALEELVNTAKVQADVEKVVSNTTDLQSKTNELTTAQLALDGDTKLEAAKTAAKAVIEALENIDTPVMKHFEDQLKDKTSIKDINSVVDQAKATNTAAKELIQTVTKAEELIKKPDYKLVPEAKKQDLNTALSAAKNLLTSDKTKLSQPSEVTDINKARENLSKALIQASGQADEILKAQKAAKDQIDNLTNLTEQQKEALKREVSSAVTNEDINSVVAKAQELDTVTKALKDAIQSANELDKNSDKYKYADENKQNAFDTGLSDANVELAKGLADKNKEQIQQLSDQLTAAQGALNGESKLADAKKDAQDKVQNLTNLSDEQKDAIKSAINNTTSPEAANAIANKATELDQAIAKAKEAQKAAAEVKATPKYTEASDTTKNPFDTNANKLDGDITAATTTADLDSVEKLNNLVKTLKEDTTKTNDANAALDGQSRLAAAKAEANGVIAGASQLSPQAASAFKDTVDKAQTIAAVNQAKDAAKTAQEAAKALVDNFDKVNTALQNAGNTLDAATAKEASDAKEKANEFLEDNKLKQEADVAEVNKAAAKLAEVLGKIKANVDALKGAQNDAIDEINKLQNLSSTQKQALTNEVKAAENKEAVNSALTKAKELDKAIGQLKDNFASIETTKATDNYKLADVDKKNDLDKVASDKDSIISQAAATLDKAAIATLNNKINTTKEALNGNGNKQAAKDAIDALNNLGSNQKSAAKDTLNQAQDKAQLDAKVQEAKDLDQAKANLQVAKDSLDALINQFTKPSNINEAALSSFNNETNNFADNKKALEAAKEVARVALEATTLNANEVASALSDIAKAKTDAKQTIETTVAKNNAIVSDANIPNFVIPTDKQKATLAGTKAVDKNANVYEDLVAAREVQHLAALDKFAKFQEALPQELKASTSFGQNLELANEELNNSNTKASDDEILAKVNHQLLKDKLALEYDAISKANINDSLPENLKQEIETQKAQALELLKYANTVVTTPRATYDAQADKLNLLLAKNDLASVIVKAQAAEKSSQLNTAIKQAQDALNNSVFDQDAIKAASDKLANEIDKAKLYVSINQANDFVKELQEGNKQHHSALRDRIVNTLSNDDIPKAVAAANKQDTKAAYNTAAAALDNAVANAKKTIDNVFKALEELRDKIATMPQDQISTQLKEQLAQAQTIKKDSGVVAIENALESLQHRYATNELDKAIAAAPTINDKYATLVPSIVEQSQAVSNNSQASTQEIASQLAKQLLNNAKGNALNTLAGLNNLNNAQASALANVIAQAQDTNQVAQDLKQAQDLDKAMATLKDTYTKVDEAYKAGTNLPYEAFFIPADKLKFAKDTIAKVGKVTPEAGQVYLDNLPAQIDQLNSDLNTALDLLGQGKGQAKAMEEEFTKLNTKANTLENNLQVNANKLYNSPKAIQDQIKDLQTKIKDLSDKYFNNHAAYMEEGNAKMKQLVEQLSNLNDQVAQFSPQVFMNNNARITQAQNLINNNSEYTSDIVAKDNLTKFNNATTFAQADKLLNEQVALNNKVKENVQQIVANLTNTLVTKQEHPENETLLGEIVLTAKPEVIAQVSKMISYVQTLSALDKSLNAALNSEKADKKFKKQIAAISTSLSLMPQETFEGYKELNEAIGQASKNIKNHANGIQELINALDTRDNEKLSKAIQLLDKSDNKNAKLAKLIQDSNYIDILNHADNKAINKDDLATVEAIKNSSEYQMASPAIQDLLNQDLNGKKPWAWWPIAVAISAITWLGGMLAILLKRK
ncbi:hypothetical protein ACNQ1M_00435 [Mycoplasma sp. VS424B]|uniref:hypothetical protein n=1 Tax=Mycoplasma sp. VS424B TaxID=3401660 RepID=UPI003AB00172